MNVDSAKKIIIDSQVPKKELWKQALEGLRPDAIKAIGLFHGMREGLNQELLTFDLKTHKFVELDDSEPLAPLYFQDANGKYKLSDPGYKKLVLAWNSHQIIKIIEHVFPKMKEKEVAPLAGYLLHISGQRKKTPDIISIIDSTIALLETIVKGEFQNLELDKPKIEQNPANEKPIIQELDEDLIEEMPNELEELDKNLILSLRNKTIPMNPRFFNLAKLLFTTGNNLKKLENNLELVNKKIKPVEQNRDDAADKYEEFCQLLLTVSIELIDLMKTANEEHEGSENTLEQVNGIAENEIETLDNQISKLKNDRKKLQSTIEEVEKRLNKVETGTIIGGTLSGILALPATGTSAVGFSMIAWSLTYFNELSTFVSATFLPMGIGAAVFAGAAISTAMGLIISLVKLKKHYSRLLRKKDLLDTQIEEKEKKYKRFNQKQKATTLLSDLTVKIISKQQSQSSTSSSSTPIDKSIKKQSPNPTTHMTPDQKSQSSGVASASQNDKPKEKKEEISPEDLTDNATTHTPSNQKSQGSGVASASQNDKPKEKKEEILPEESI